MAAAVARGWIVQVIPTQNAPEWLSVSDLDLEEQTGGSTQNASNSTSSRNPSHKSSKVEAVIIAPASYNTINKLALGISDNHALDVISPLVSKGIPFVILPFVNLLHVQRVPLHRSVRTLQKEGVTVLLQPWGSLSEMARLGLVLSSSRIFFSRNNFICISSSIQMAKASNRIQQAPKIRSNFLGSTR